MKELIRTSIMNLTLDQWTKIREIEKNDFIYVTPKELFDLIGRSGGMFLSGLTNDREKRFVKLFYQYKPQIQRNENRN